MKTIRTIEALLERGFDCEACGEGLLNISTSGDSLDNQLIREGFMAGDLVAIVKLSDLQALIANQVDASEPKTVHAISDLPPAA